MSIYRELDPMVEHRTQLTSKVKREHISKVNISNIAYPSQHIDTEIPHSSKDHVIKSDTVKITFNLDIEPTDKARSVVNNVDRALVKKKVLKLGSKDIDLIDNSDIYNTYKDLYLRLVMEILNVTCLASKMQWHTLVSPIQAVF